MKIDRNNNLRMVRGDTEEITVKLREQTSGGTADKPFVDGDTIKMTIGEYTGSKTERPVAMKTITGTIDATTGLGSLVISPSDTADMEFGLAKYKYDIQITFADGTVKTLFPAAWFILEEEVSV